MVSLDRALQSIARQRCSGDKHQAERQQQFILLQAAAACRGRQRGVLAQRYNAAERERLKLVVGRLRHGAVGGVGITGASAPGMVGTVHLRMAVEAALPQQLLCGTGWCERNCSWLRFSA